MSNIGFKQGCPLSPTLYGWCIDELETYLDEIDGDYPYLVNIVVAILQYANGAFWLSRLGVGLQRLLNKLNEFCTSSSLEVNSSKTKLMIFGRNKRKWNQEAFYLDKDQIEITREYKCLGIDFCSHGYFEQFSKRWGIAVMEVLMRTLRKETVVGVTCWELKSHLFKALVLPIKEKKRKE